MDVRVSGEGPLEPFLRARDLFETEYDLELPVEVRIRDDPDERTHTGHTEDGHILRMSRQAATSAMARELAIHEFAHMYHNEQGHPSHVQSMEEVLFLALAGRSVERRVLTHCYQIANHMKDIYADDITLSVTPADKLVAFFESSLAAAIAERPPDKPPRFSAGASRQSSDRRLAPAAWDPEITAVNAAFALGLCERNGLLDGPREVTLAGTTRGANDRFQDGTHRLYDFARVAAADAPGVDVDWFRRLFRSLAPDPDESEYRKSLVDATREYAVDAVDAGRAAD